MAAAANRDSRNDGGSSNRGRLCGRASLAVENVAQSRRAPGHELAISKLVLVHHAFRELLVRAPAPSLWKAVEVLEHHFLEVVFVDLSELGSVEVDEEKEKDRKTTLSEGTTKVGYLRARARGKASYVTHLVVVS